MARPFEILEHPADVGFLAYGSTLEEMFANAALAMITLACDSETVRETEQRKIEATGEDAESLLFAWLAEILAVMDAERLVLRRVVVEFLDEGRVRGVAHGEKMDRERHRMGVAIKAVTFHQLAVENIEDGWRARVFLDL
ncbi:MAG TPA: archease [Candidatus Acidoferrales bacterium]|nr:archease [Candidatus Acidoferrales bacterium]